MTDPVNAEDDLVRELRSTAAWSQCYGKFRAAELMRQAADYLEAVRSTRESEIERWRPIETAPRKEPIMSGNKQDMGVEPRFFIDHGMIHDRVTGKHVTTEPDEDIWNGGTITSTCELLNELSPVWMQTSSWASPALDRAYREVEQLRSKLAQPTESGIDETLRRAMEAIEAADCELVGIAS